jgi:hypothetical protein
MTTDLGIFTVDRTGPLSPLVDVDAGDELVLVAAQSGRIKVSVNHAGDDGSLWLGMGQTAQQDVGEWLEPGGRWEEFYAGAVHVLNTSSTTQRVTWMEWGA